MKPLALCVLLPSLALAHSAGLGTAVLRPGPEAGTFSVRVRLPIGAPALEVRSPGCELTVGAPELSGAAVETRLDARCDSSGSLALEVGRHPLIAHWEGEEPRVLEEAAGWVELPLKRGEARGHFLRWLWEGVLHILSGLDHLLFLFGLCLLRGRKRLVAQVTTFSLAHSLSLAVAAFGWVRLPAPPVEACIALSIAWVGWAALQRAPHGLPVIFAFGLLHGLGFASALGVTGLPLGAAIQALLGFNLGVEVGQLLVLVGLLPLVAWLGRAPPRLQTAIPSVLGAVGVAWTLERVAGFWS